MSEEISEAKKREIIEAWNALPQYMRDGVLYVEEGEFDDFFDDAQALGAPRE